MFSRFHTLTALLSVALHLLDLVVAAGHQHVHAPGEGCSTACVSHEHTSGRENEHGHGCGDDHGHHHHAHSHGHAHAKPCPSAPCQPRENHPASKPHHDCAICQHLALTPALVSPASPCLASTGSEPVVGEVATLLPPLRTVARRSRAPPVSLA